MRRLVSLVGAAVCVVVLVIGAVVASAGSTAQSVQPRDPIPVHVMNGEDQPVPVNATIVGASVVIVEAVQASINLQLADGTCVVSGTLPIQIPMDRGLVVEHVSGEITLTPQQQPLRVKLSAMRMGSWADFFFTPSVVGNFTGAYRHAFSQPVRAYADSNTQVVVEVARTSCNGMGSSLISLSGYFARLQ